MNEIFRRENSSYNESLQIERVAGKRNWPTLEENRARFESKEKLSKELQEVQDKNEETHLHWLEYMKEQSLDQTPNYDKD